MKNMQIFSALDIVTSQSPFYKTKNSLFSKEKFHCTKTIKPSYILRLIDILNENHISKWSLHTSSLPSEWYFKMIQSSKLWRNLANQPNVSPYHRHLFKSVNAYLSILSLLIKHYLSLSPCCRVQHNSQRVKSIYLALKHQLLNI